MEQKDVIKDWLIRLSAEIGSMRKDTREIKITLGKQEVHLRNHIKRTDLLEDAFRPIQRTLHQIEGIGKFLAISSVGALIVFLITKFLV